MPYIEKTTVTKRYFTITEVSAILDVSCSKLRFYEEERIIKGDYPANHRSSKPRKYSTANIDKIRRMLTFRQTGHYTLQGLAHIYTHGKPLIP